jgi:hypothetical protein
MYVENVGAETVSGGVYDLWKDKCIKHLEQGDVKPIMLNKYAIKLVASEIMTEIDDLCDKFKEEDDSHRIEVIGDKASELLKRIKNIRKVGLKKSGESSSGNIVYKAMKRSGYLEKLWKLSADVYDKLNSVNEEKSFEKAVSVMF